MVAPRAATRPDAIRRHNLAVMLAHIHHDGALTRAELTARLGVSRSTIGALVSDLTQLGLVEETRPSGGAGVGRPSHLVAPSARGPFAVAVDVDVTHVTTAAIGVGGRVLARDVIALDEHTASPQGVAQVVADAVPRLRALAAPASCAVGIGVSVPGTVDHRTGRIGVAPNLGWTDAPLGDLIRDLVGRDDAADLPVAVSNDADLAVLAEYRRGGARGYDDVIYVLGRVGVGAGIIVGGLPLRGYDGHAGEIGHDVVDADGPACHCGKRGCVETYVGDGALLRAAGRDDAAGDADAVVAVFADARAGDPTARRAVQTVATALGRALAGLVNALNPQRLLLGGTLAQLLDTARPQIETALGSYALEAQGRTVQLALPELGADSALLGAAELAFAALLADPLSAPGIV